MNVRSPVFLSSGSVTKSFPELQLSLISQGTLHIKWILRFLQRCHRCSAWQNPHSQQSLGAHSYQREVQAGGAIPGY